MVYLLHFQEAIGDPDNPRGQAKHYLGYARDVKARCEQHRAGTGARLLHAVGEAGIPWALARIWHGDRKLEKRLKARHDSPTLCPFCSGSAAYRRGNYTTGQELEQPARGG